MFRLNCCLKIILAVDTEREQDICLLEKIFN